MHEAEDAGPGASEDEVMEEIIEENQKKND